MSVLTLFFSFFLLSAHAADPLSRFSVDAARMNEFTEKCVRVPTTQQMEKEVRDWIQEGRKSGPVLSKVILDGLPLQSLGEHEFKAVRNLTINRGAHGGLKNLFRFSLKTSEEGVYTVTRSCISKRCGADEQEKRLDLTAFAGSNACADSLCASRRLFGDEKGLMILWAYAKLGTNLSPLSDHMADPVGLDTDTIRSIVAASLLLPLHLKNVALKNSGFFRYLKGRSLPMYKGQRVVANSFGGVFDPIDGMSFSEKIYFFIHELAHRARLKEQPALDESPEWMLASGWKSPDSPPKDTAWASLYAKVNPFEDFAESYSLYRLDPLRLKKISPARYEYMKTKVFEGLEYTQDLCTGSGPRANARIASQ